MMQVRDKDWNWTTDATNVSDEIKQALMPLFRKCMKGGMLPEAFFYLVGSQVDEMINFDLLDKNGLIRSRKRYEEDDS